MSALDLNSNGRDLVLTPTEKRLLAMLRSRPGKPVSRAELIAYVMNGAVVLDRTIDVHIRALRVKLGPDGECIQTVRGIGYRWCEQPLLPLTPSIQPLG